jgi:hypothetical protein
MTRATRPARTGTARPSARKARGRPLSYMSQKYASARPVAGKTPCLNPGWMFAMELTPDLGAARCRANGRRYHRAGQHRLPTASTDAFWASYSLIWRAVANGDSQATLPFLTSSRAREVRARSCRRSPLLPMFGHRLKPDPQDLTARFRFGADLSSSERRFSGT